MSSSPTNDQKLNSELKDLAIKAMEFSHSPYSTKRIGAAIRLSNGQIYSGCNIENASYGGTVCAERVAIWKAFSENKKPVHVTHVAVASAEENPWPPCGFCRQVLAEFAKPDTEVILTNTTGKEKAISFKELFPFAFEPEHLNK
ncbi:cytidine deaminase [Pseudobdellovibrio sp. HCB154]|uniref:cytidine deaminase n=1 Tax=Pseudobdellovibrio sp. HCB154 TaxID=3386277 RepID=UPI00391707A1